VQDGDDQSDDNEDEGNNHDNCDDDCSASRKPNPQARSGFGPRPFLDALIG
jgi:hypothetical protein